ncbi:calcium-binding protein [Rhodovibrionaceae bacterium A322]
MAIFGTSGNDSLVADDQDAYGLQGDDRLVSPDFSSSGLMGGYGNDTYVISGTFSVNTIYDSGGTDVLRFDDWFGSTQIYAEIDNQHLMVIDQYGFGFMIVDWEQSDSRIETYVIEGRSFTHDEWRGYVESQANYVEYSADDLFDTAAEADEWRGLADTIRTLDALYQLIEGGDTDSGDTDGGDTDSGDTDSGDDGGLGNGGSSDLTINGSETNDELEGGSENEELYGREGADIVKGGGGQDYVQGNQGDDTVLGGGGDDTVRGGKDDDEIDGDDGDDLVMGDKGSDTVFGGTGNDYVRGGQADDRVSGENQNDTLMGDLGNDTLVGGHGADLFLFRNGDGDDLIQDFDGSDGDRIQLRDTEEFEVRTSGGKTVITYNDDDQITLEGVTSFDNEWIT